VHRDHGEDFRTIHHELGHNYYQRAYNQQPFLFRDSANDGFHEAIGDTIALSVTPAYLKQIGLIDASPTRRRTSAPAADGARQGRVHPVRPADRPVALEGVLRGDHAANYNAEWWKLQEKYQGVAAPVARTRADFDPGAKYHVPANVSVHALLPRARPAVPVPPRLCKAAGYTGPLNRCSIYGNKERERAAEDAADGRVAPVAEAMQALTGETQDGRDRHARLLRAAPEVARRAEQGPDDRLVGCRACEGEEEVKGARRSLLVLAALPSLAQEREVVDAGNVARRVGHRAAPLGHLQPRPRHGRGQDNQVVMRGPVRARRDQGQRPPGLIEEVGSLSVQGTGQDVQWVRGLDGKAPKVVKSGSGHSVRQITAEEFATGARDPLVLGRGAAGWPCRAWYIPRSFSANSISRSTERSARRVSLMSSMQP
jgi:hypothetical protein